MANTKVTQRDYFNEIIALAKANERNDLVEFCESRIALLEKKTSKVSAKKTAEVDANTTAVYDALVAVGKAVTVTELTKTATNAVKDFAPQKTSAYLKKLVESGKAVKTTEKKVSYFKAVAEVEDAE